MRQFLASAAILVVITGPVTAQDEPPATPLVPFLEEWAEQTEEMMRELFEEMEPEVGRMTAMLMLRLRELTDAIGSLAYYELPEILPNGDIIIRRRPDAPPLPENFLPESNDPIDL